MFFFFAFIDCVAILCLKLKFVNLFRLPKNSLQLIQSKQRHISAERASDLAGGPAFKERNNAIGWSFDRLCACFRGDARPHSSELRLGCCVFYYYYFFSPIVCERVAMPSHRALWPRQNEGPDPHTYTQGDEEIALFLLPSVAGSRRQACPERVLLLLYCPTGYN